MNGDEQAGQPTVKLCGTGPDLGPPRWRNNGCLVDHAAERTETCRGPMGLMRWRRRAGATLTRTTAGAGSRRSGGRGFGRCFAGLARRLRRRLLLAATALSAVPSPARADATGRRCLRPTSINFALVIGAISAAMLSAIWLIRERAQDRGRERRTSRPLSAMPTRASRAISRCIVDKDRRIVVWEGAGHAGRGRRAASGRDRGTAGRLGLPRFRPLAGAALGCTPRTGGGAPARRRRTVRSDPGDRRAGTSSRRRAGSPAGAPSSVSWRSPTFARKWPSSRSSATVSLGALETLQALLDALDMPVWMRDDEPPPGLGQRRLFRGCRSQGRPRRRFPGPGTARHAGAREDSARR